MTAIQHLCRMVKYVVAFLVLYCVLVSVGVGPDDRRTAVRVALALGGAVTLGVFAVRTWQKVKPVPPTPAPPPAAAPAPHAPR